MYNNHFYVGSMYDDIRLQVARSYTSSADSPSLWYHPSLCPTIFSPVFSFPSLSFTCSAPLELLASHAHTTTSPFMDFLVISPTLVVPLILFFLFVLSISLIIKYIYHKQPRNAHVILYYLYILTDAPRATQGVKWSNSSAQLIENIILESPQTAVRIIHYACRLLCV